MSIFKELVIKHLSTYNCILNLEEKDKHYYTYRYFYKIKGKEKMSILYHIIVINSYLFDTSMKRIIYLIMNLYSSFIFLKGIILSNILWT